MYSKNDNNVNVEHYFELLKAASEAFDETVYVIDFKHQRFRFVSNKGMFLGGRKPEEILSLGYDFYSELVHKKDILLFTGILQAVTDYFSNPNTPINNLSYVIFDFRICGYKGQIRLSHKVIPLVVNNQALMAICSVCPSAAKTSGNLIAYYNDSSDFCYRYSFEGSLWEKEPLIKINQLEWDILNLSKQGITGREIADIIGITEQYLRNVQVALFEKLNVNNTRQALIFVTNHRVITETGRSFNKGKSKEPPKIKKPQKKMTPEKLHRIQEALNMGESVNSIAKRENIGEYTVRYAIRTGKLKKET